MSRGIERERSFRKGPLGREAYQSKQGENLAGSMSRHSRRIMYSNKDGPSIHFSHSW